jgi:hypothetical protein
VARQRCPYRRDRCVIETVRAHSGRRDRSYSYRTCDRAGPGGEPEAWRTCRPAAGAASLLVTEKLAKVAGTAAASSPRPLAPRPAPCQVARQRERRFCPQLLLPLFTALVMPPTRAPVPMPASAGTTRAPCAAHCLPCPALPLPILISGGHSPCAVRYVVTYAGCAHRRWDAVALPSADRTRARAGLAWHADSTVRVYSDPMGRRLT